MEYWAFHMLGKQSPTKLHPSPWLQFELWRQWIPFVFSRNSLYWSIIYLFFFWQTLAGFSWLSCSKLLPPRGSATSRQLLHVLMSLPPSPSTPPPRSTLLRTSASCSPRLAMIFWQKTRSQPCYTTTANSWRSTSQQRKSRPSSACSGGTASRGLLWLDWGP